MSLIRRKKPQADDARTDALQLISLRAAAEMLCLDESTIRKRLCGTTHFKHVRQGTSQKKRIYLVRSEVEAHLTSLIDSARNVVQDAEDHVWA